MPTTPCSMRDCQRQGLWVVGFSFAAVGGRGSRASATSSLVLCSDHKQGATVDNTFGRAQLLDVIRSVCVGMRIVEPDPDSLALTFSARN